MFGCSMIPRKLRRFLECETDWMQNSSYWKSFDWLQQRINNNLGKFSDPSAVLSFPPVCCHMVQSDRACSLSRCWLLYLALLALPTRCLSVSVLQQVVWGAGCDLTDISVSGTARQDTTYLSLSLSLSLLSFPKNTTLRGLGGARILEHARRGCWTRWWRPTLT